MSRAVVYGFGSDGFARAWLLVLLAALTTVHVAVAADTGAPLRPRLDRIEPATLTAGSQPVRVVLSGKGFVPGSRIAVSRNDKVKLINPDQVEFIDANTVAVVLVPGEGKSDWVMQLSTPDNRHSNIFRFTAEAQAVAAVPPAVATAQSATRKHKDPAQNRAGTPYGQAWLAAQPAANYTIQLIAGEERARIEQQAQQLGGDWPTAVFTMRQGGRVLHALVAGSFTDRAAAERAAGGMTLANKPWVRSLAGVQQVMLRDTEPKVVEENGKGGLEDAAWVWSRNPVYYTLQIAVSSDAEALESLARGQSVSASMALVDINEGAHRSHLLLYGNFPSKEAARAAIESLPEGLSRAGPWPRPFASIHDLMSGKGARQ